MKTGKQKITLFLKVLMVFLINRRQFFHFRNSILQQAIEKVSTKIEQKYNSDLSIRKATLTVSVDSTEISLVLRIDTLFSVQKMKLVLISGICYLMFNWVL
jgi:hypothetical protein